MRSVSSSAVDHDVRPRNEGRLPFIDGLRGIAALVVMAGHAMAIADPGSPFAHAGLAWLLLRPFLFGEQMVWLFILLSGFALYWSENHRWEQGRSPTTLTAYARRRSWRILPTYYVALAVGFIVVVPLGGLLTDPSSPSVATYKPVTMDGLVSHLALAHTLSPAWAHQFNPPLWSIAFEAQLYVLFPVLLMMVVRRTPVLLACATLMLGVEVANRLLHLPMFGLAAWFFAGVVSAHTVYHRRLPHRVLLTVATGCILLGFARVPPFTGGLPAQVLWLVGFACLVTGLVRAPSGRWNIPAHPAVVWLGHRSYSLYAIHFPVLLLVWACLSGWDLSHGPAVAAVLAIGLPAAIVAADVLYRSVERPALTRMKAAGRRREAAVQS